MTCPALYGYLFITVYTSSPRATTRPSASSSFGIRQNGHSSGPSVVARFSPLM